MAIFPLKNEDNPEEMLGNNIPHVSTWDPERHGSICFSGVELHTSGTCGALLPYLSVMVFRLSDTIVRSANSCCTCVCPMQAHTLAVEAVVSRLLMAACADTSVSVRRTVLQSVQAPSPLDTYLAQADRLLPFTILIFAGSLCLSLSPVLHMS